MKYPSGYDPVKACGGKRRLKKDSKPLSWALQIVESEVKKRVEKKGLTEGSYKQQQIAKVKKECRMNKVRNLSDFLMREYLANEIGKKKDGEEP